MSAPLGKKLTGNKLYELKQNLTVNVHSEITTSNKNYQVSN